MWLVGETVQGNTLDFWKDQQLILSMRASEASIPELNELAHKMNRLNVNPDVATITIKV